MELGTKGREIVLAVGVRNEVESVLTASDRDEFPRLQGELMEAVEGGKDGFKRTDIFDFDLGGVGNHERAVGESVGSDRGDDDCAEGWVHEGAAGGEGVCGRAGRAGDDDAVGKKGVEIRVVDVHLKGDHARIASAMDNDVVDCDAMLSPVRCFQHQPLFHQKLAGKFLVEERLMLEASHRGKHSVAINDVVIHRGSNPSMIALKVHINDSYFNTFLADGIIIA